METPLLGKLFWGSTIILSRLHYLQSLWQMQTHHNYHVWYQRPWITLVSRCSLLTCKYSYVPVLLLYSYHFTSSFAFITAGICNYYCIRRGAEKNLLPLQEIAAAAAIKSLLMTLISAFYQQQVNRPWVVCWQARTQFLQCLRIGSAAKAPANNYCYCCLIQLHQRNY